jgi:nitrile hydratase subunit beta
MDGIHDLGGREGFGPIDVNEREVPFHHPWEPRMWAIAFLTGARDWTIDWWRHVRELIDPADYLTRRYFDQWMQTQTAAMIDSGMLTVEEIAGGACAPAPRSTAAPMRRSDVVARVATGAIDYSRKIDRPPVFAPGDRVRARAMGAAGHTRLPAYVRGRAGEIHAHHGAHLLPDAGARGEERAEHIYSVRFTTDTLWPEAAGRRDRVYLDLWESYLERP